MSTQSLMQLYGARSSRTAIARAMRSEMPNGNELLEAEGQAFRRLTALQRNGAAQPELTRASKAWSIAHAARVKAENEIRRKHGMPERHDEVALPPTR